MSNFHQFNLHQAPRVGPRNTDKHESSADHWQRFSSQLNQLRLKDQLTDFTIHGDEELMLRVHKIVLAANSDYFKTLLTNYSYEPKDGQAILTDIDPETIKIIVDFWYTNQMKLTSKNVCSVLLVATRFQAQTALEVSTKFAEANLTAANCLSIAVVCERCNLTELAKKAFILCLEHFEEIIQCPEFFSLDEEFLLKIVSDDRLRVSDEIYVFEAIVRWIKFDESSRSSKLKRLMHEVRFASINPVSLVKQDIKELAESSAEYRELVDKARTISLIKGHPELYEEHAGSSEDHVNHNHIHDQ